MNLYSTIEARTNTRQLMQAHFITHTYRAECEKCNTSFVGI